MGTRIGSGSTGTGSTTGSAPNTASETDGGRLEHREHRTELVFSGSELDSDSADEEDTGGSGGDKRGVKRERSDREDVRPSGHTSGGLSRGYGGVSSPGSGVKPGKKTRGRVKIKMEFIDNKLRRYTTFSKRKTGIMKKVSVRQTCRGQRS